MLWGHVDLAQIEKLVTAKIPEGKQSLKQKRLHISKYFGHT